MTKQATTIKSIRKSQSVFIDSRFGDDLSAIVELEDKPFATIGAAMSAIHLSKTGNWIINVLPGTYNEAGISSKVDYTYYFNCSKGVVINCTESFTYDGDYRTVREVFIDGGIWNYTGASIFFDGYQTNKFNITNATIISNSGTHVFGESVIGILKSCKIIAATGFIFKGHYSLFIVSECEIIAETNWIFNPEFPAAGAIFKNCTITSLTHGISNHTASFNDLWFGGCAIQTFGTSISAKSLDISMLGTNTVTIANAGSFIDFVASATLEVRNVIIDTLVVKHPIEDTSMTIQTGNDNKVICLISGGFYSTNSSTDKVVASVGLKMNAATIGNNIVFNLPSPYDNDPINYTIVSTVIADEITAIAALVQAQIDTGTADWYLWALDNEINIGADSITVFGNNELPSGFSILPSTITVTDDYSEVVSANIGFSGMHNYGNGVIKKLTPNSESFLGNGTRLLDLIKQINHI